MGVIVVVDRGAVDDLGNLIASVVIVEDVGVERQRIVQEAVLGPELEGLDIFRLESQRMNDELGSSGTE